MDCRKVSGLLSQYIDDMLEDDISDEVRAHIEICNDCNIEYQEMKSLVDRCKEIDEINLPDKFSSELHRRLNNINTDITRKMPLMSIKRYTAAAVMLLILSAVIFFKSGIIDMYSKKESKIMQESAQKSEAYDSAVEEGQLKIQSSNQERADSGGRAGSREENANLYYDIISVEIVEDQYKQKIKDLSGFLIEIGGIKENEDQENFIIPKEKFQVVLNKLRDAYKFHNVSIQRVDVSEQYMNLLKEIDSLKGEQNNKSKDNNEDAVSDIDTIVAEKEKEAQKIKNSTEYVYVTIVGKIH